MNFKKIFFLPIILLANFSCFAAPQPAPPAPQPPTPPVQQPSSSSQPNPQPPVVTPSMADYCKEHTC